MTDSLRPTNTDPYELDIPFLDTLLETPDPQTAYRKLGRNVARDLLGTPESLTPEVAEAVYDTALDITNAYWHPHFEPRVTPTPRDSFMCGVIEVITQQSGDRI